MKTYKNISPGWGDFTEVTPADYQKKAEIYGTDEEITSDDAGIYANGVKVAEPIKETQRETHTPGPWEADNLRVWAGTEEAPRYIASLKFVSDTNLCDEETEANTLLIAAAPEMLQALQDALKICQIADRYFPKSIKNSDRFDLCNIENNSIKKAIAKAEGSTL